MHNALYYDLLVTVTPTMSTRSPLNLYINILWVLDFKYISLKPFTELFVITLFNKYMTKSRDITLLIAIHYIASWLHVGTTYIPRYNDPYLQVLRCMRHSNDINIL